jgi:CTP:molybdopterin cytidylyltransferase MocA
MTDKQLKELAHEIDSSLQSDGVSESDRKVLEQVQSELQAVLGAHTAQASAPVNLRERLTQAVERLEGEHPRLTQLLSKTLDVLSDVGI